MNDYIKLLRKAHFKIQEIEKSSGYQIYNEIKGLKDSVHIYRKNFSDLEVILNQFKDVDYAVELISERFSKKRDARLREFLRAFHNFIVSVKSLVEHARNFMKLQQNTELSDRYFQRIKNNFRNNNEVKFLEKLRNYFCHYRLPEFKPKVTIDYEQNSESSNINLSKESLLKFDGWGKSARKYISKHNQEINIHDIIYRYNNNIDKLYNWLFDELEEFHSSELEKTEKLIVEYEKISERIEKNSPFNSQ